MTAAELESISLSHLNPTVREVASVLLQGANTLDAVERLAERLDDHRLSDIDYYELGHCDGCDGDC